MTATFILQDNVPLPAIDRRPRNPHRSEWRSAIDAAQVGQFFFVPGRSRHGVSAYIARITRNRPEKFETRRVWAWFDHAAQLWRVCKHDAVAAVEGVGVWRTE